MLNVSHTVYSLFGFLLTLQSWRYKLCGALYSVIGMRRCMLRHNLNKDLCWWNVCDVIIRSLACLKRWMMGRQEGWKEGEWGQGLEVRG